jgi:hypothetical protein
MNGGGSPLLPVRAELYHDKDTRRTERTGQMTVTAALRVTVRDLDALDGLGSLLAAEPGLNVHGVTWHVDWDNPAWPQVRAAAIRGHRQGPGTTPLRRVPRCAMSSTSPTPDCSAVIPRPTTWSRRGVQGRQRRRPARDPCADSRAAGAQLPRGLGVPPTSPDRTPHNHF